MSGSMRLSLHLRREWLTLILSAMLLAMLLGTLWGPHGPHDLLILRRYRGDLEARREQLAERNAEVGTLVQRLRSDARYLERLIRKELGYAREGELIYRFSDDASADAR